jgi:hypothetical protein
MEVDVRDPKEGEVLIRYVAAGLCPSGMHLIRTPSTRVRHWLAAGVAGGRRRPSSTSSRAASRPSYAERPRWTRDATRAVLAAHGVGMQNFARVTE